MIINIKHVIVALAANEARVIYEVPQIRSMPAFVLLKIFLCGFIYLPLLIPIAELERFHNTLMLSIQSAYLRVMCKLTE